MPRDDGDGSRVRVTDTGAGVPPEQAAHVFERFFRGDAARGRATGAGLGLSIAQWIASVHRATIDFQSEPGRGTIVGIHFPPPRQPVVRAAVSSP